MRLLLELARRQGLQERLRAMASGEKINLTERRAVLHTATRAAREEKIMVDGEDVVALVHEQKDRIQAFSEAVTRTVILRCRALSCR